MGVGRIYSWIEWNVWAPWMEKILKEKAEEMKPMAEEGPWMGRYYERQYESALIKILALEEAKKVLKDPPADPDFGIPSLEDLYAAYFSHPKQFFEKRFYDKAQEKVVLPEGYECLDRYVNVQTLKFESPLSRLVSRA